MRNKKLEFSTQLILFIFTLLLSPSCVRKSEYSKRTKEAADLDLKPYEKRLLDEEKIIEKKMQGEDIIKTIKKQNDTTQILQINTNEEQKKESTEQPKKYKKISKKEKAEELDFWVQNLTGKKVYLTCFSYIKKRPFTRWRWDKSDIYTLESNQKILVDIDTIPDQQERENVYGYLALFDIHKEAVDSTYELLDDDNKIDLDLLYKLKNQVVKIGIEKYGVKGNVLDYDFVPIKKSGEKEIPELDFIVENKTGKPLYITCFVYQLKPNLPVWRYDKTTVQKVMPNEYTVIDVDTIATKYERVYLRGYLGIFNEDEKEKAEKMTYELLEPKNKISIERLAALKNKKIVLEVEKYGVEGNFIDYSVKPIQRIDFKKAIKKYVK